MDIQIGNPFANLFGLFGRSQDAFGVKQLGDGKARAMIRLREERKATAERLKNAPAPKPTRQQYRAYMRRVNKMPIGISMKEWHQQIGLKA